MFNKFKSFKPFKTFAIVGARFKVQGFKRSSSECRLVAIILFPNFVAYAFFAVNSPNSYPAKPFSDFS